MDHNVYEEFVSSELWDRIKTTLKEKQEVLLEAILDPNLTDMVAQQTNKIEYNLITELLRMPKDIHEGEEA